MARRPPKRWRDYAPGTEAAHFAWWTEAHLVHSADRFAGKPFRLEPWQLEVMGEALALDEVGQPFWASVALILPRKNGKTSLLAAVALYRLLHDEGQPEILLAAASDKQAGRLFEAVVAFVRRNPELARQLHLREYMGEIARVDGGGKILRMASDPATLHGYNPTLVVCDELHAWQKPSQRQAWSALTTGGGARKHTQVITISTAGEAETRDRSILGRLLEANEREGELERLPGLTISRNRRAQTMVYNWSAPTDDPSDVAAMKLANPASWITKTYLRRQAENPELTSGEVLRLHGCVWAAGIAAWIPADAWSGCAVAGLTPGEGEDVFVGADIGLVDDSSAVSVAWRLPDERVAVDAKVWAARSWIVSDEQCKGGVVEIARVEEHLRELCDRYRVQAILYDPRFFEVSAQRLALEGLPMASFAQNSGAMAEAYETFHRGVHERTLAHPDNSTLNAHVLAAIAERTDHGWKVSKTKARQAGKIDAAVAAVMAHFGLLRNELPPSIYETRPLLLLDPEPDAEQSDGARIIDGELVGGAITP